MDFVMQSEKHGMFDYVERDEDTLQRLNRAMDTVIWLDDQQSNVADHYMAESNAINEVHKYCDRAGVGTDEQGLLVRERFAIAIDALIKQKINISMVTGNTDASPQDIIEYVENNGISKSSLSDSEHWRLRTSMTVKEPEQVPLRKRLFKSKSSTTKNQPGKTEDSEADSIGRNKNKRLRRAMGALAITAVAAVAVFGVSRGNNQEPNNEVGNKEAPATTTTSLSQSTYTTTTELEPGSVVAAEATPDVSTSSGPSVAAIPSPQTQNTGSEQPSESLPTDGNATVSIETGSLWNQLQVLAVGHHGSEADSNHALEVAISDSLPEIATANGVSIDALSFVIEGQKFTIPPSTVEKLKSVNN